TGGLAGVDSAASAGLATRLRARFSAGASSLPGASGWVFSDKTGIPRWQMRAPGSGRMTRWVGCAGLARLAAATFRRDGGRAARPDLPTLAPGSWRRQALREAGGACVQARAAGGRGRPPRRLQAARVLSIIWVSWPLPTAPTWVAWTWPSLNSSSIGIERTWYLIAVARFWSMLTLATFMRPS